MDYPQECVCGRRFSQVNAMSHHRRTCKKSKTRLSSALTSAREEWSRKRARRNEETMLLPTPPPPSDEITSLQIYTAAASLERMQEAMDTEMDVEMEVEMEAEAEALDMRPIAERKPTRPRVLPGRYTDTLPESTPALFPLATEQPSTEALQPSTSVGSKFQAVAQKIFKSSRNIFGLSRTYFSQVPVHDPEQFTLLSDFVDPSHEFPPSFEPTTEPALWPTTAVVETRSFYPYPNRNSFLLGNWYWCDGVQKSQQSFDNLINIIGNSDFSTADIQDTKWSKINTLLREEVDQPENQNTEWEDEESGWVKTPVTICVPFSQRAKNPGPKDYTIPGFYHRSLTSVIKEKLANVDDNRHFHYEPFELHWHPNGGKLEGRVYGELYSSPEFIKAHADLQESPGVPKCDLPRVVLALMFWSDTTHLTSFGKAQLWPLYMGFGNESKYRRCRPSLHLLNHVAYFEKLPDAFKDFANEHTGGRGPSNAFFTHCHRELLHAQWSIILDDEFMEAYENGLVVMCCDGMQRRFYPRMFTYSADYPEKALLASIRNMGGCPCPRCLIPLHRVHNLGMPKDRKDRKIHARKDTVFRRVLIDASRKSIYGKKNCPVNSKLVENRLKEHSYVPTHNAFSKRLSSFPGFNMFDMFVVDLMHEFELGVWKGLFIHLMRLLQAINPRLRYDLDKRYRLMPTFGKDTIRRFTTNSSEMKKMAAHDFEDLLQCAMPVFEGLFPAPHDKIVQDLLFLMAHWHGLAKLRLHTDYTLAHLDVVTTKLGEQLRLFQRKTCAAYRTGELPRETAARKRRKTKVQLKKPTPPKSKTLSENASISAPITKPKPKNRVKAFNLNTYKTHSLGDYVDMIKRYGTTDLLSTEPGELEHKTPKARYKRTSRKNFLKQITSIERREAHLRSLHSQKFPNSEDPILTQDFETHHQMGKSQNEYEHIGTFLSSNSADPAVKNFLPKLKEHLLPRIKEILRKDNILNNETAVPTSSSSSGSDRIFFIADKIYKHRILRINYTTYDIRRSQDIINPNTTHSDVMVLANSDSKDNRGDDCQRFLYARVLGIFHANVVHATGAELVDYRPRRIEFLWVRWFQSLESPSSGWNSCQLEHLIFPLIGEDDAAFGFIDPLDIIRGCHILPKLALGPRNEDGRGVSKFAKDFNDWRMYYVNRFVDRDMVMRFYWGLGVGHVYSHDGQTTHSTIVVGDDGDGENDGENVNDIKMEDEAQEDDEGGDEVDEDCDDPGSALGMEDRENDDWMDENSDENEGDCGEDEEGPDDDAEFLERYNMYGL